MSEKKATTQKKKAALLRNILSGDFLSNEKVRHQFLFFAFIALLGIIYISNGYSVEKTKRKIIVAERRLDFYHTEYVSARSQLSDSTKQSNLIRKLQSEGITASRGSMKRITVNNSDL